MQHSAKVPPMRPTYVHCLSFVDIEEDATGRDLMTFNCTCDARNQRGLVFTK